MRTRVLIVDDEALPLRACAFAGTWKPVIRNSSWRRPPTASTRWNGSRASCPISFFSISRCRSCRASMFCASWSVVDFHLIFQTAFDEFALKAFEVNACDYLLKPFTDQRLQASLDRALPQSPSGESLARLESHLVRQGRFLERLVVTIGNRAKLIPQEEVLYFLSESHYTQDLFWTAWTTFTITR